MTPPARVARIGSPYGAATALITDEGARLLTGWRPEDAAFVPPPPASFRDADGAVMPGQSYHFLPPLTAANKVVCLGLNYRDHAEEAGEAPPENPALFIKLPDALVGHDQPLIRPRVSQAFDFEGEIAVVIGRKARHVAREDAMSYVYGYTILMDGSLRDFQQHSPSAGKCFHASGSIGPWIVPASNISDLASMTLETRLNGERMQFGIVSQMIYDIPTAIAYVSQFTPLNPGDIISMGTPAGVGATRQPPVWMKPGDLIEVEVSGVGILRNTVADET